MKTRTLLFLCVLFGNQLLSQETGPIPKINGKMTDYFHTNPKVNVYVFTDKTFYKPGETIWFRAMSFQGSIPTITDLNGEVYINLFNRSGIAVANEIYKLTAGSVSGDLSIPANLPADNYYLVAHTSAQLAPDELSFKAIKIDPEYGNQWVVNVKMKDSISISGQKNQIYLNIQNVKGEVQNNVPLKYQITNGEDVISKGKLKTDNSGNVTIDMDLPAKTNGEPFICSINDPRNDWSHNIFIPTDIDPVEIKFYPEGGTLITGIATKIGFSAFNKWGVPVDVEGSILSQDNKPLTAVRSITPGLGIFSVINNGNQKLRLVLSGKNGNNQSYNLPAPNPLGLALTISKTDTQFISVNLNFADKQKHNIALMVTHGNILYWAADMELDGISRIKIPTETILQGVNLLSVFTHDGELLAERLFFTDKNQNLNIAIKSDKETISPNGKMNVKVKLTDENNQPVSGNLVISVTNKFSSQNDQNQLDKYLQADSELENPFSLVSGVIKNHISNSALLDIFLIANHPKGFSWEKILNDDSTEAKANNTNLAGNVTDKNGKKINKAKVTLLNNKNMQLYSTTTNAEGNFSFPNLNRINSDDFTAKATDQDGKRELNISFLKNYDDQISEYIRKEAIKYQLKDQDRAYPETYVKNNEFFFQKAPKVIRNNNSSLDNQRKLLESSTSLLDVIKTMKPYKIMNNQIVFIGSENSLMFQTGALLVMDGQQLGTDISSIQGISPMEVDHINVSTNPVDIQAYTGLNNVGLIEIFLKKAHVPETISEEKKATKYESGYRISTVFTPEENNFSNTLLWIPELAVGENGKAEFSVTAGKVISDFIIDIQGITNNGRLGSGELIFSVKE